MQNISHMCCVSFVFHFDMLWCYMFSSDGCPVKPLEERTMCGPSDLLVLASVCSESGAPGGRDPRPWLWKDGGANMVSILKYCYTMSYSIYLNVLNVAICLNSQYCWVAKHLQTSMITESVSVQHPELDEAGPLGLHSTVFDMYIFVCICIIVYI